MSAGRLAGLLVAAALCLGAGPLPAGALYDAAGVAAPRHPRPAPDFSLETPDGARVTLADNAGQVLVVNFWATWCKPCVAELPALQALAERHAGEGLRVLAVNVDRDDPDGVTRFATRLGLGLPIPMDPEGEVRRAYRVRVLPTTYLIGRDGRIAGLAMGERPWDGPEADALVRELLAKDP